MTRELKYGNFGAVEYISGRFLLQVTGHRSQVIVLPIQKVSQTLVKANLRLTLGLVRPKQTFLVRPKQTLKVFGIFSVLVKQ